MTRPCCAATGEPIPQPGDLVVEGRRCGVCGPCRAAASASPAVADPVKVAQRVIGGGATAHWSCSGDEVEALARVVLAAAERVKHGHSKGCASLIPGTYFGKDSERCTCGHDALAAALRGE
jgi:hypothetical protein